MLDLLDKPASSTNETTLIDSLLAEQKQLSAIERFSQQHENTKTPIQESSYKDRSR